MSVDTETKTYTPRLMRREAVCIECGHHWHPMKSSMARPPRCHNCDSRQIVWLDEHPELKDSMIEDYKVPDSKDETSKDDPVGTSAGLLIVAAVVNLAAAVLWNLGRISERG